MAESARQAKAAEPAPSPSRIAQPARPHISRRALDSRVIQPSLRVSQPSDAAEVEADRVARAVVSMPDPGPRAAESSPPAIQRKPTVAPPAPSGSKLLGTANPDVEAQVRNAASGGRPLPGKARAFLEPRFGASFAGVSIHTDSKAAGLSSKLGAKAFTYGSNVFFGGGAYDHDSKGGMELIAHELTHTIQQGGAIQRKALAGETQVNQRTGPQASRLGLSDALNFFADAANAIPGYRMFTILIGMNPINGASVEASAANILRAIVEFLPGGNVITRVLDSYGIFDKVGGWIEGQLKSLGISGASIKAALDKFMDSLSWKDIFNLGGVWDRAKAIFTEPIGKIISFAKSLFSEILRMVREAVLRPLAALAEGTAGYPLLKVIIGMDPVTGDAVEPTADNVIGGLMTLIGQDELWGNIQRARAIPRAWAWFKGAMGGLKALVTSIPDRFIAALKGLEIMDFVVLPSAFAKLAKVFGNFLGDFGAWALGTVIELAKIIVEVVAPGVMPYIAKAGAAFNTIVKNPVGFVQTLVAAALQGFNQFRSNFLTHLKASLIGWVTGALGGAGVYIPQGFSLVEIVKFVLSVLGLTWANVRAKLVKATSEPAVVALETGFDLVKKLVTEGPAAVWQQIVQSLTNLKDMIISQAMDFVKSKIVEIAVTKLLSMLSPAGAIIQAILAIWNTIMFFKERISQIAAVAASFIDSIATIASGNIGPAANRVEQTMAGMLTLVISFLARIAGLGKVSDAILDIVKKIRAPIDKGLDKAVTWVVAQARKLGKLLLDKIKGKDDRTPAEKQRDLEKAVRQLQPIVNAALAVGIPMKKLRPLLAVWKFRFKLTQVALEGDKIVATINPKLTVAEGWTFQDNDIFKICDKIAAEEIKISEDEVKATPGASTKERRSLKGKKPTVEVIDMRQRTSLAAGVVAVSSKGRQELLVGGTKGGDPLKIGHSVEQRVGPAPWFKGIGSGGVRAQQGRTYDAIAKDLPAHLPVGAWLGKMTRRQPLPKAAMPYKAALEEMWGLMMAKEPSHSKQAHRRDLIYGVMAIDLMEGGKRSAKETVGKDGIHPAAFAGAQSGAKVATRQMEGISVPPSMVSTDGKINKKAAAKKRRERERATIVACFEQNRDLMPRKKPKPTLKDVEKFIRDVIKRFLSRR